MWIGRNVKPLREKNERVNRRHCRKKTVAPIPVKRVSRFDSENDEDKVVFLSQMLNKYKSYMPSEEEQIVEVSGAKSSIRESLADGNDEIRAAKAAKPFLERGDVDLLFPSQMKSYYASAEF